MAFDLVDHVHRLAKALLNTELRGIRVDIDLAVQYGIELQKKLADTEQAMHASVAHEIYCLEMDMWSQKLEKYKTERGRKNCKKPDFSFSSPKQLGTLLYEYLDLPEQTTKKGAYATNKDAMAELEGLHPLIEHISTRNSLSMYHSTFIQGVLERLDEGRIYPSFNVAGTVTGRISHQRPNMGNMPARDPEWSKIRGIFLPDPGHHFIKADYSQLEVSVAAHYSQDKNLLKIVLEGASQHDITAAGLGIPRGQAKTINFAMQYGAGVGKIQRILECSRGEAEDALNKYWETYQGLKRLIDECHAKVDRGEDIVSLFGRRRRFEKRKRRPWDKAYRQSFNALGQGTGGDITSMALYRFHEEMERRGWGQGGWTIHDEVIGHALVAHSEEALDLLAKIMVDLGKDLGLTVPLAVDPEGGLERWKK